jgi:serine/threonine-protein kinase
VDSAVWIIEQAATGLNYAHTFKDKLTGESLHLVHRDVSPQNLIVSYDGGVKVIDFGIAKAKTNSEATRVGVIKGKPSYLSPEQIIGTALDGRSDVFALGAVLWEVLAGQKLFQAKKGENEFAVLKLIESADAHVKPPSSVNPQVPKALDEIVMRSLAKDRERRYQTAEEFARALRQYLSQNHPK